MAARRAHLRSPLGSAQGSPAYPAHAGALSILGLAVGANAHGNFPHTWKMKMNWASSISFYFFEFGLSF